MVVIDGNALGIILLVALVLYTVSYVVFFVTEIRRRRLYLERMERIVDENVLLSESRDRGYSERDQLVALISKLYPAGLERHEGDGWEDDWRWIVFIDLPTGQASWHIHDSELNLFQHLPRFQGRVWDGHTTEEKYRRISQIEPIWNGNQDVS